MRWGLFHLGRGEAYSASSAASSSIPKPSLMPSRIPLTTFLPSSITSKVLCLAMAAVSSASALATSLSCSAVKSHSLVWVCKASNSVQTLSQSESEKESDLLSTRSARACNLLMTFSSLVWHDYKNATKRHNANTLIAFFIFVSF